MFEILPQERRKKKKKGFPRSFRILIKEKKLDISHSLLRPPSVKSVGTEQYSEVFLGGRGYTKHTRSESFLNVEFGVWLCGKLKENCHPKKSR